MLKLLISEHRVHSKDGDVYSKVLLLFQHVTDIPILGVKIEDENRQVVNPVHNHQTTNIFIKPKPVLGLDIFLVPKPSQQILKEEMLLKSKSRDQSSNQDHQICFFFVPGSIKSVK